uniref:Uncharacterized protein n=1 Tax=Favella ehrenbergii TaxID=182087 RepID=A0A7S3HZ72_9SPIT|mmetsp:Transcript_22457/g.27671  ORF Transcript_22457/g.27671 Transcript_22457/m.27671 type:complete len:208 (+) Transcript_22457:243-866(+)
MLLRVGEGKPFASQKTEPTIGVDCKSKTFLHEDLKVRLQLWDTAGQERFRTLTTSYYRGTHCCVLVFDITNPESFYHLYQWIDQYNFYCEFPMKNIIIVGNKYDMEAKRQVSELEIRQFCESMDCLYVRCSVLSDEGVEALITTIISKCIELEDKVVGAGVTAGAKSQSNIFSLGGSDGITSGDIGNINPMRLDVPKKKAACCLKGQ